MPKKEDGIKIFFEQKKREQTNSMSPEDIELKRIALKKVQEREEKREKRGKGKKFF